jgi:hypothetical protein
MTRWRASCEATKARASRRYGSRRSKTFSLVALPMLIVAPSQHKENRHEAFDHLAIAAGRLRRPEHVGSKRRRMRRRRIPGRLRRGSPPCRRSCAASRGCRPASGGASQSILIVLRCILVTIALAAAFASIVPIRAQTANSSAATISSARELIIGTKEAPPFSMKANAFNRQSWTRAFPIYLGQAAC